MKYRVKDRQSILDVQLICCGDVEGVMNMCVLNDRSISDVMTDGELLDVGDMMNSKVVSMYDNRGFCPATGLDGECVQGGIGYMAIGVDFIVS